MPANSAAPLRTGARAVLVSALLVLPLVRAVPAAAEPATPTAYPAASSATRATGLGFDTCTAPPASALQAWWSAGSPYRTVNTYFGGVNRGCSQPELTAAWVSSVARQGWRILPTWFGAQPFCKIGASKPVRYDASTAAAVGDAEAVQAVRAARALGFRQGSALYADVEHYDTTSSTCVTAVRRYVSAWTERLHSSGYLAGAYVHMLSGAPHLSQSYGSTAYARPDAVWVARWDGNPSLRDWATVPNSRWAVGQRIKQYRGDHDETWGGVTLNIDSDALDAPVATVALPYRVTSSTPLSVRSGPSTSYPVVRTVAAGSTVAVLCQGLGKQVGSTSVWDRLTDGGWVTDLYLSTPSRTGFSRALPRCAYPGQVTSADGLTARTGPGTSYPAAGAALPPGALAWVACQRSGSTVGTTRVWDRLVDGRWVSDYYVSNRSNTTFSTGPPRC